jgi:hypothetical protein
MLLKDIDNPVKVIQCSDWDTSPKTEESRFNSRQVQKCFSFPQCPDWLWIQFQLST